MVNVDTFGESSYGLMIYVWIDTGVFVSTLVARDQVINKITRALEAKGIKLPTPMQHILVENL
jgi:small-conductance mechanosensitive channel